MSFSVMTGDLQARLKSNLPQVRILLKRNPAIAYSRITEIGRDAGRRYGVDLIVNFPHEGKIDEFDMYGRRDLSIILDRTKTRFPIGRDTIKQKAREVLGGVRAEDAYMYEGKEGVKIFFEDGRIDILPHSIHIWCEFTARVTEFCNWVMSEVYLLGREPQGGTAGGSQS